MLYRVVARIWDPIWLTVFLLWFFSVHKVSYVYFAIISRLPHVNDKVLTLLLNSATYTHNKDTTNICSHITTDLIMH